ncbi:HD domain-containing protein, partial [bacterium]|nr:HD domain-containing protein [bacterium]
SGVNSKAVTAPIGQQNLNGLCSPQTLLATYSDTKVASNLLEKSPAVKNVLMCYGVTPNVYPQNIANIKQHINTTTQYALMIANAMGISNADKNVLETAAVFHDFGKILIPESILNKPSALTSNEKNIMDLHASLGAELLKSTGLNKRALDIVSSHHLPKNKQKDLLSQILSVADIYSALREERSYKAALSEEESLKILDQKAGEGEVSTEVVDALRNIVSSKIAA